MIKYIIIFCFYLDQPLLILFQSYKSFFILNCFSIHSYIIHIIHYNIQLFIAHSAGAKNGKKNNLFKRIFVKKPSISSICLFEIPFFYNNTPKSSKFLAHCAPCMKSEFLFLALFAESFSSTYMGPIIYLLNFSIKTSIEFHHAANVS